MLLCMLLFPGFCAKQAALAEAVDAYLTDEMHKQYRFDSGVVSVIVIGVIAVAAVVLRGNPHSAPASTPARRCKTDMGKTHGSGFIFEPVVIQKKIFLLKIIKTGPSK